MNKEKKKLHWQIPFLIFLIIGSIYAIRSQRNIPFQKEEGTIFGTIYHVTYQCDSSLQNEIMDELRAVDNSLSPFNENSIISKINRNETVKPDPLFTQVFQLSEEVSDNTNGAFDITVAPLVNAWGFGFTNSANITPAVIDSLLQFVGYKKIALKDGMIVKSDPRIILDCSAVAKGFGVDQVARLFDRKGIKNYMVEIGGEVVVKGNNPKQKEWHVGIHKPTDDSLNINQEIQTILKIKDKAMATSGNYRNFYYKDGKKYAHTINPVTGYPVQHSILSSTVLADNCATADAYATAFMVLGLDEAQKVLKEHPEIDAYFIYADKDGKNQIFMTDGLKKLIDQTDNGNDQSHH